MIRIPDYVFEISQRLQEAGYEAYLVGGSLRDILMNIEPHDFDIATNAMPEDIMKVFPKSIPTGAKFGTVVVLIQDEKLGETNEVQVTTYRSESDYVGGRWPSKVEFSREIMDDLKRRDFTVNAMAFDLQKRNPNIEILNSRKLPDPDNDIPDIEEYEEEFELLKVSLLDPFNGKQDIENSVIRAVGDPLERFREDGLRPMRACRLASILGFTIENATFDAIKETLDVAALISKERVRDEFVKLIEYSPKPSVGLELMRKSGLLGLYIPELLEGYGMEQNKYHVHDVYQHLLDTVDIAPKEIRIAALFHDIGKPRCKQGEHFYSHDQVGAEMTEQVLRRLKFSRKLIYDTANLVRWHMFFLPEKEQNLGIKTQEEEDQNKNIRNKAFHHGWRDGAVRRLIRRVGGHEQVDNLIKLRIADAAANPKASFDPEEVRVLAERVAEIREQDSLLSIKDLQINGHDLMEVGITGPRIRQVQEYLLEKVMDDIELNNKEDLIRLAKEQLTKNKE